jgi:hypothetical protein
MSNDTPNLTFRQLKEQHSDVAGLMAYVAALPWYVWFDSDGTVTGASKEDQPALTDQYARTSFTSEQIGIVQNQNWSRYRVVPDKLNAEVYHLENKPAESNFVATSAGFLSLVDYDDTDQYDIRVGVTATSVTVTAHTSVLTEYQSVDPASARVKGSANLTFYLTAYADPSFLYQTVVVSFRDLLTNKQVVVEVPGDFTDCSVYTIKRLTKYVRA